MSGILSMLAEPGTAWMDDALCREPRYTSLSFFPALGEDGSEAKAVCGRCLVREECLEYALAGRIAEGVWGGTSPAERKAITRDRRAVEKEQQQRERELRYLRGE